MTDKKKINAKVVYKLRGDTVENLQKVNPILALKEPCFIIDENNKAIGFKIGDGISAWNELDEYILITDSFSDAAVDQTFNPESENAQSGVAIKKYIDENIFNALNSDY